MKSLLKTYQKRLTNLSSRNKSLVLNRTSKIFFFDFHELDFVLNKSSFELLDRILFSKKSVQICSINDPRDEKSNLISKDLHQLFRSDQLIQAERGAQDLQIGFPYILGTLANGNVVRAPLMFFPVELSKTEKHWNLKISGSPAFNNSFLLAYQQFANIKLPQELIEEDFQDFPKNLAEFILELYNYLKDSLISHNFNSSLFTKTLRFFENYTKSDFEILPQGELKLQQQAVLGIFPQGGSFLSQDYEELLANGSNDFSLENHYQTNLSQKIREQDLHLPLPVDASQEAVIRSINNGNSLVVQGPPGSGKSQLIANIMADFAAKGKKVLLVCQKRAAIDTVYKRLSEVGMGQFAALVHDYKTDRKSLFNQLSSQIDRIEDYRKENYALDAIFLEREFNQTSQQIEKVCEELDSFKAALYDDQQFGVNAKSLYLLASKNEFKNVPLINLQQDAEGFNYNSLNAFIQQIKRIQEYNTSLNAPGSEFWKTRKSSHLWTSESIQNLKAHLSKTFELREELDSENLLPEPLRTNVFNLFESVYDLSSQKDAFEPKSESSILELEKYLTIWNENETLFSKLNKGKANELLANTQNALAKAKSKFGFWWYKQTDKNWKNLVPWLQEITIENLTHRITEFLKIDELKISHDIVKLSEGMEKLTYYKKARRLHTELNSHGISTYQQFLRIDKLKKQYETQLQNHQFYFFNNSLEIVFATKKTEILDYLESRIDYMREHDSLINGLSGKEKNILAKTDKPSEVEKGLLTSFINILEEKHPILRAVSSHKLKQLEEELQSLVLKKKELSKENLLIQLKETTYRKIDKNRLGNTVTYRELKHQTSKKKRIWPIRKILESFTDEVFQLVPCWMASPETVSAIFPMQEFFDLVIFDEASQCFAEKGLPAMLRGKQVLIAGDKQQLQPNDLYRVRYEEEENEDYKTEIDSLLNLAQDILPNFMLTGHYRSKSLPLINFSNQHFYQNRLKLIPDFVEVQNKQIPLIYTKVYGVWENKQNQAEAEEIQRLVAQIKADKPDKTIGIVTFNQPQANLIQDLVSAENVSIKNIENIQGDEFDIVIFSVAYAPDKNGKMRVQFGTLSAEGGENRLNVAITRAREQIYLVTSIRPDQLNVENTLNLGPKLLKAYLKFVFEFNSEEHIQNHEIAKSGNLSLAGKLIEQHAHFTQELPFADIAIKDEKSISGLILTDDQLFYQNISAKESFAYLPLTLQAKSWQFSRSWSRNYWKNISSF